MSQFCTQCGTQNIDEAMFCKSCGHPMENQETIHYSDSSPSSYSTTESTTAFHSSTIDDNEDINEPWSAWLLLIPIVIWFIYRVSVLKNGVALLFVPAGFAEMLGHAVPIVALPLIITGIIYLSKNSYPNFMKHTFIGSMISLVIVITANINSVNDEKRASTETVISETVPVAEAAVPVAEAPVAESYTTPIENVPQNFNNDTSFDSSIAKLSDNEYLEIKKMSPEYASVDSELGKTFSMLRKTLSPYQKRELKIDERNWIESRDQQAQKAGEKGSQEYIQTLIELTQERIQFLNNYQP